MCLTEFPTQVFGEHLKQQVEDRLKFYETGETPEKNVDVMKKAIEEVRCCIVTKLVGRYRGKFPFGEFFNECVKIIYSDVKVLGEMGQGRVIQLDAFHLLHAVCTVCVCA